MMPHEALAEGELIHHNGRDIPPHLLRRFPRSKEESTVVSFFAVQFAGSHGLKHDMDKDRVGILGTQLGEGQTDLNGLGNWMMRTGRVNFFPFLVPIPVP